MKKNILGAVALILVGMTGVASCSDKTSIVGKKLYKEFGNVPNPIWVEVFEVSEFDEHGKLLHQKNRDGDEAIYEYDGNGNEIHFKSTDRLVANFGGEMWSEYDGDGNCIHVKCINGYEVWYDYDQHGHKIHEKSINVFGKGNKDF